MKNCPNCNSSVNDTAKFCKKCGFNIKKYEEQNANIIVFCEECGAKIPSDSVFCEECGFQIITTDNESNSGFDFGGIGDISDSATEQLYHRNGLKVENGVLVEYTGKKRTITIPGTIEEIFDKVFENNDFITKVVIEEGVRVIGKRAFAKCTSLKEITIPSSCSFKEIYKGAFDGTDIEMLILPKQNDEIFSLFINNDVKQYLTDKEINEFIKKDNESITIDIKSMKNLAEKAKRKAEEAKRKKEEEKRKKEEEAKRKAEEKRKLEEQLEKLGMSIDQNGVLVGYYGNATSIVIPYGVQAIGDKAFKNCENLKSVVIPSSVKKIGWDAFYNCRNLTSIEIPSSVTSIGSGAFTFANFSSVKIPYGVTEISSFTFSHCKNLTSIEIPSSVEKIGCDAFWNCEKLKSIRIPSGCRCDKDWNKDCPAYVYYY